MGLIWLASEDNDKQISSYKKRIKFPQTGYNLIADKNTVLMRTTLLKMRELIPKFGICSSHKIWVKLLKCQKYFLNY